MHSSTTPSVVAVFGRRGSGKTTRARAIASRSRRVVVFDPVGEWSTWREFLGFDDLGELQRALARRWRGPFRLAFRPSAREPERDLHRLARLLYMAQSASSSPLLLVVDEAHVGYPAHALPNDCWGMRACVLQGRHRRIGVLAVAQRPALVSADLRGNAHEVIVFPLSHPDDRRAIERVIGPRPELETLRPHCFLHWIADSGVTTGRNKSRGRGPVA